MFSPSPITVGTLFALLTACGLGSITTLAKLYYADGGDATTLMLVRFIVSTIVFGLIWFIKGRDFTVAREQRIPLALLGLFWSGGMICYLVSVQTIPVSLAVLIFYTYPLLVLLWSILRLRTRPSLALTGLFIGAFTGLFLMLSGGEINVDPRGIVFAALASVGAAFTFVCGARVAPQVPPLLMVFWINASGLVIIAPLLLDGLEWPAEVWPAEAWPTARPGMIALALATLFYLIAILSQFEALARLPAASAALILNLEPAVSILMARLIIDEVLSPIQWSGVIMVISIILLSMRLRKVTA